MVCFAPLPVEGAEAEAERSGHMDDALVFSWERGPRLPGGGGLSEYQVSR